MLLSALQILSFSCAIFIIILKSNIQTVSQRIQQLCFWNMIPWHLFLLYIFCSSRWTALYFICDEYLFLQQVVIRSWNTSTWNWLVFIWGWLLNFHFNSLTFEWSQNVSIKWRSVSKQHLFVSVIDTNYRLCPEIKNQNCMNQKRVNISARNFDRIWTIGTNVLEFVIKLFDFYTESF